jgi:nucleotide-binding universal stress UspA family protein
MSFFRPAGRKNDIQIVMGMRESSNLAEMSSSVSAQVLRHARCPVLQIP